MRLKRSLGQVFLKDRRYLNKIISSLGDGLGKVVEIGPGSGRLTRYLLPRVRRLYCVEVDRRLCDLLEDRFKLHSNIKIIHGDILGLDLSDLGSELIVIGNIPYRISKNIIEYLVVNRIRIERAYLTVQKEFAKKITARPKDGGYGYLSCRIQYYASVKKLFDIHARAFSPRPKVDSSFVEIKFYKKPPYPVRDEKFLFAVMQKAFNQRRKKICNILDLGVDFAALGIDPGARPGYLSLRNYAVLANAAAPKTQ